MEGLTVGRIVHYVANDGLVERGTPPDNGRYAPKGEHKAAVVAHVFERFSSEQDLGMVNLHVFVNGPTTQFVVNVRYSESMGPNTWHWIERD